MKNFNPPEFSICVTQHGILSDVYNNKKAQLILYENTFEVDILDNEYFEYLDDSASKFELVVEYENDSHYDLWTMTLKVNDLECNDFIIVPNDDFHNLQNFISKLNLFNKLDTKLVSKASVKKSKI